ncbi:MAG: nucleotidyltransferase [Oligoflexia bacterium]|nr:nucleotidyltransferase [Oligoflexia bacterium]
MKVVKPLTSTKVTTEDPDLADRFDRVLAETVKAIEEAGIRYAFIGGIASGGLGRPRSTHDIDLFVMPEDAEITLRALSRYGFKTERTDPSWLYKGFKDGVLVDVIFRSKGEIYLDAEMYQRMITAEFHGRRLRLVAPEDLLIIKAAAHSELTPSHWHDAIALLSHANLDWDYLIRRARRAPRRVLSLLLYAQSNDVWVPNNVIHELYTVIFGDTARPPSRPSPSTILPPKADRIPSPAPHGRPEQAKAEYGVGHLREALAEDPRTNELDIEIEQAGNRILLRGEVPVADRRDAVEGIARERFPGFVIENQIRVISCPEPTETEEVR